MPSWVLDIIIVLCFVLFFLFILFSSSMGMFHNVPCLTSFHHAAAREIGCSFGVYTYIHLYSWVSVDDGLQISIYTICVRGPDRRCGNPFRRTRCGLSSNLSECQAFTAKHLKAPHDRTPHSTTFKVIQSTYLHFNLSANTSRTRNH